MEHKETGCRAPEGSILCINNCGFFGHATTMNMCSKCHKDQILKEQQALLAASSIESIVNGSVTNNEKDPVLSSNANVAVGSVEPKTIAVQLSDAPLLGEGVEPKPKEGPSRCSSCHKRLGLTGFKCRCGNHFCGTHRYAEKHDCPFDYRMEGKDAIAKANPVVKAEKIDKI